MAFGSEQPSPQPPQFVLVVSSVSHPLFALPSQLPHPELHEGVHTPPTHWVLPCAFEHTIPHPPQLPESVFVFFSQPLAGLPSQLA